MMSRLAVFWVLGAFALLGAAEPARGASPIKNAVMARGYQDGEPKGVTTVFRPSDRTLHCVVYLDKLSGNTRFKAVWVAVEAPGVKNYTIVEKELETKDSNHLHFTAALPRDWPVGKYHVKLFVDGKLDRTVPFTVRE